MARKLKNKGKIRPIGSVKEVKTSDLKIDKNKVTGETVFTNDAATPIKKVTCFIPESLVYTMRGLEEKLPGNNEFGLYLKGCFDEEHGYFEVTEDYYLPKQQVTGATIDFDHKDDQSDFNGVIHRHPSGCTNFSGTDEKYINANHEFSLLYVNNNITRGILNVTIPGGHRIQLDLDIVVEYPNVDISGFDLSKVTTKVYKAAWTGKSTYPGHYGGGYSNGKSFGDTTAPAKTTSTAFSSPKVGVGTPATLNGQDIEAMTDDEFAHWAGIEENDMDYWNGKNDKFWEGFPSGHSGVGYDV